MHCLLGVGVNLRAAAEAKHQWHTKRLLLMFVF